VLDEEVGDGEYVGTKAKGDGEGSVGELEAKPRARRRRRISLESEKQLKSEKKRHAARVSSLNRAENGKLQDRSRRRRRRRMVTRSGHHEDKAGRGMSLCCDA
jgi:hypothetical protein